MLEPQTLLYFGMLATILLMFVVFLEFRRSARQRECEVMIGTDVFEEKAEHFLLSEKERHTMEKLVRCSIYSNKDALFNSANLFENAVNRFYEFRKLDSIREITLDSVTDLRKKLGFTVSNEDTPFISTRQLEKGVFVKLLLASQELPGEIEKVDEKLFSVRFKAGIPEEVERGASFRIRWTRPGDAVYTIKTTVLAIGRLSVRFTHETNIDKFQLRRWVRESVDIPVQVRLAEGKTFEGRLLDLSAGGILLALPESCDEHSCIPISFELPGYERDNVDILILRRLNRRDASYPELILHTASFAGEFGWTQEKVLQYIFEIRREKKRLSEGVNE